MNTSVNKVILVGQLGKEPEVRTMNNGAHAASLSVATTTSYKKNGEWVNLTEWNKVITFNEFLVEAAGKLNKGDTVYVEGTLKTRKWTGKDGKDNYTTEIVLEPYKGVLQLLNAGTMADQGYTSRGTARSAEARPGRNPAPKARDEDLMDDIPF